MDLFTIHELDLWQLLNRYKVDIRGSILANLYQRYRKWETTISPIWIVICAIEKEMREIFDHLQLRGYTITQGKTDPVRDIFSILPAEIGIPIIYATVGPLRDVITTNFENINLKTWTFPIDIELRLSYGITDVLTSEPVNNDEIKLKALAVFNMQAYSGIRLRAPNLHCKIDVLEFTKYASYLDKDLTVYQRYTRSTMIKLIHDIWKQLKDERDTYNMMYYCIYYQKISEDKSCDVM